MEDKKSYKLLNITLVESKFSREIDIDFEKEIKNSVNIEIEDSVYENVVTIGLTIILNGITDEKSQYEFKVKYVGVFEIGSEVELPVEKFIQANGPAILFPFLREHIASMSLKANISPILLPPINFLKFQKNE